MSTPHNEVRLAESIVDALLPNESDESLWDLANTTFIDDGCQVPVSPLDQLLMTLARRLLTGVSTGNDAVVQLPRALHRSAFLLAICSHLLCRRPPVSHSGPVVLVGFDIDVTSQLRSLGVQNRRRMGLADGNPLSLHRLTGVGAIRPAIGTSVGEANRSLIYYNTRVGSPRLECRRPLVVLDATTVAHPAARERALQWAIGHQAAAIVAVGDLGDDGLINSLIELGIDPVVLPVTDDIVGELIDTLGRGEEAESSLSSMSVLARPRTLVRVHQVEGGEIDDTVTRAYLSLAGRPPGPIPSQLNTHVTLLRNGSRLAARADDYRSACVHNPRPGEMPVPRLLERNVHLSGGWKTWGSLALGSLKVAVRALWRALDEENPKLLALWRVLDSVRSETEGQILVRGHSRAAAEALRVSLSESERTNVQHELWNEIGHRVRFATLKERFPAASFGCQVLTGAPPPWMFSHLLGIEADNTHVLTYGIETAMLGKQGSRWSADSTRWHSAACQVLSAQPASPSCSPIPKPDSNAVQPAAIRVQVPGLSLADVLDQAEATLDPGEATPKTPESVRSVGAGARRCVPVRLADGRTWWCHATEDPGDPVLIVTAGGHEHRPVGELRPGDRVLVPAGDGTESIHARLISASRNHADVRSLDLILSQFRSAARHVLLTNASVNSAIESVRLAGASASGQLTAWAAGTTIAPREPDDVAAVFRAAKRPCPDLDLIHEVANRLRSLSRALARFVAAIASGGSSQNISGFRDLVGPIADELLDEFVIVDVEHVGEPQNVRGGIAGRLA